jgi:hypothetical protein
MKQVFVLRTDRGHKVVDACHLNHSEQSNEPKPRGLDLLVCRVTVQCAPHTRLLILLVFSFCPLGIGRRLEQGIDLADDRLAPYPMLTLPPLALSGVRDIRNIRSRSVDFVLGLFNDLADGFV